MHDQAAIDAVASRPWFYEFDLPGGRRTECYRRPVVAQIHSTRLHTLMLGLLYHLENPVGAIRVARALTRKACVIETQAAPVPPGPGGVPSRG